MNGDVAQPKILTLKNQPKGTGGVVQFPSCEEPIARRRSMNIWRI